MLTRLTRMARMLTHMLTRMTRWLAGSHIIHTRWQQNRNTFSDHGCAKHPLSFFVFVVSLSLQRCVSLNSMAFINANGYVKRCAYLQLLIIIEVILRRN